MDHIINNKMNEEELYKLEVELIKKHHSILGKVKPRSIKLA